MNPKIHSYSAAAAFMLGLLGALCGCATSAVRQSTSEMLPPVASTGTLDPSIEPPSPLRTVAPNYPHDLRRSGVTGQVMLSCTVDETGRVRDASVEKATSTEFGPAALDALRQWTFQPGRRNGQPSAMRVTVPMRFELDDK